MADKFPVAWWVEVCNILYAEGEDRALPLAERFIENEGRKPYLGWTGGDVPEWLSEYVYIHLETLRRNPDLIRLAK